MKQPLNALIVKEGEGVQDAVPLGDGIFMSKGISNSYLVQRGNDAATSRLTDVHQRNRIIRAEPAHGLNHSRINFYKNINIILYCNRLH